MRYHIILLFVVSALISCNQKSADIPTPKPDYLSSWFIQNEDSLFHEFNEKVQTELFSPTHDTNWGEYAFVNADTTKFMGRFTLATKKYCDGLDVTFFYNKSTTPHVRILLSTNYNKNFTTALDTIFNFVPKPKHFIVDKYEKPDLHSDGFRLPGLHIDNKDLRISMQLKDSFQNLKIFIYSKSKNDAIDDDNKYFLKKVLFGEELLLKKIGDIDFIMTDTLNSKLLTLTELRNKLK